MSGALVLNHAYRCYGVSASITYSKKRLILKNQDTQINLRTLLIPIASNLIADYFTALHFPFTRLNERSHKYLTQAQAG